nr:type I pullulanase [bacterium]
VPKLINGKIKVIDCELENPISVTSKIDGSVSIPGYKEGPLVAGKIVDDPYYFKDIELGALYSENRTIFRAFAPTAAQLYVNIYEQPKGGEPVKYKMSDIGNGIWEASLDGNLANKYYTFHSVFINEEYEIMDPYSKCNTATRGRCIVVAPDNTDIAKSPIFPPSDAVIYQLHVREISIHPSSGVKNQGKYLGLAEYPASLPSNKNISTMLSHIEQMGVNAVQIMPFQDFDNDEDKDEHNWGYMPFHFNSPEGSYSTKRDDITRVIETKKMIDAFHKKGIKVVLDVVYNHTAEGNPEVRVSFNGLAPNYYYRVRDDGGYSNGSGCGNEFRSESLMGRKYIIDSLKFWVKEYGIDGFRFDLMGLIDLETMKIAVEELKKIKPDILVYGEPWTGGNSLVPAATVKGTQKNKGFGCFNDHFRSAIKAGVSDASQGYLQAGNNSEGIKKGVIGSVTDFAAQPNETINYIECHDNYSLWDKLVISTKRDLAISDADRIEMDKLGAAIILTSQGIPFIQVGQDFLRSKDFIDNPYNKGDKVNQVDWTRKEKYLNVSNYYKGLIKLRADHPLFRLKTGKEIKENIYFLDDDLNIELPSKCVSFIINKGTTSDRWENALAIYNPNPFEIAVEIPESEWFMAADKNNFYEAGIKANVTKKSVRTAPRSVLILYNTDENFSKSFLKKNRASKQPVKQLFKISAPDAKKINVAGTFNNWDMNATPLNNDGNGNWSVEVELEKGTYEFKYIQDNDWDKLNKDNRTVNVKPKSNSSKSVLFEIYAPNANEVTLAGSFNEWNNSVCKLDRGENGKWSTYLTLEPGEYEYKFLQNGDWDLLNKDNRKIKVSAGSQQANNSGTLFEIEAPAAGKVTVAGSFNEWNTEQYNLEKNAEGKWFIRINLKPGIYEYKFLQDGDWDKLNASNRTIEVK